MPRGVKTVMLAPSQCIRFDDVESYRTLKFPMYASPKLDGVRMVVNREDFLSRSFKPLPCRDLRRRFMEVYMHALTNQVVFDGEMWAEGHEFSEISGSVRRVNDRLPDWIEYWVFDFVEQSKWDCGGEKTFGMRIAGLRDLLVEKNWLRVRLVPQKLVRTVKEAEDVYKQYLEAGHEGMMLKDPYSGYKHGRATVREATFFKVKSWDEAMGKIVGFKRRRALAEEFLTSDRGVDEMGRMKRTHRMEHYQDTDEFGSVELIVLSGPFTGVNVFVTFAVGKWPEDCRWDSREQYLDQIVMFEYLPCGSKEKPRHGRIVTGLD